MIPVDQMVQRFKQRQQQGQPQGAPQPPQVNNAVGTPTGNTGKLTFDQRLSSIEDKVNQILNALGV